MKQPTNTSELKDLLVNANVDYHLWGKGSAKTLDHLTKEIQEKDCYLSIKNKALIRHINVATGFIFFQRNEDYLFLVEEKQVFEDGRQRERKELPSIAEKMKPDEAPLGAIMRALEEELSFMCSVDNEYGIREQLRKSNSYPGLMTETSFFDFCFYLPAEYFCGDGYREQQSDKTTYFVWKKV